MLVKQTEFCQNNPAKHHRVAIEMLLAEAPRRPKPAAGFGITVGGKEEAWEYRSAHRTLWERDGALGWLRDAWSEVRGSAAGGEVLRR